MSRLIKALDRYLYPRFQDNWDIRLFRQRIVKHINPSSKILDLGAGAGVTKELNFKGLASCICGVDVDERVLENPYLDEAKVASAESTPYSDETFDVVICVHVLEHLLNPERVFREVHRVLKKNGVFLIKTPNKYHYVPVLSKITPYRFHRFCNAIRGREKEDTFPTFYNANTKKKIISYAKSAGFALDNIELIEGRPEYLRTSWPTYLLGVLYERIVNAADILRHFRAVILVCLRKNESASSTPISPPLKSIIREVNQCVVSADTRGLFNKA